MLNVQCRTMDDADNQLFVGVELAGRLGDGSTEKGGERGSGDGEEERDSLGAVKRDS